MRHHCLNPEESRVSSNGTPESCFTSTLYLVYVRKICRHNITNTMSSQDKILLY